MHLGPVGAVRMSQFATAGYFFHSMKDCIARFYHKDKILTGPAGALK
jgi:hypothetical protein